MANDKDTKPAGGRENPSSERFSASVNSFVTKNGVKIEMLPTEEDVAEAEARDTAQQGEKPTRH